MRRWLDFGIKRRSTLHRWTLGAVGEEEDTLASHAVENL
jgi:hypothetical protein